MAGRTTWRRVPGLALVLLASGCSSLTAYRARFTEPAYTVTPEYYERSPRRVAVFPFATRRLTAASLERAQTCRIAFYQHFCIRDFEDVDLHALDRRLVAGEEAPAHGLLQQFTETVRWLDVVGVTSFLDWKELTGCPEGGSRIFREWVRGARKDWQADAYVLGITRGYGRLYAVVFSTLGLATHVELRSTKDDALLWSAERRSRSYSLPLTIDPMSIPTLLYQIWRDSRGDQLDILAFHVYRDLVATLPAVRAKGPVWVRADRPRTRIFRKPTLWTFWPGAHVPKGRRMAFLGEKNGWVHCKGPYGRKVWILCRDGTLVDDEGEPLPAAGAFGSLWAPEPPEPSASD
jgi:hypothetical protein